MTAPLPAASMSSAISTTPTKYRSPASTPSPLRDLKAERRRARRDSAGSTPKLRIYSREKFGYTSTGSRSPPGAAESLSASRSSPGNHDNGMVPTADRVLSPSPTVTSDMDVDDAAHCDGEVSIANEHANIDDHTQPINITTSFVEEQMAGKTLRMDVDPAAPVSDESRMEVDAVPESSGQTNPQPITNGQGISVPLASPRDGPLAPHGVIELLQVSEANAQTEEAAPITASIFHSHLLLASVEGNAGLERHKSVPPELNENASGVASDLRDRTPPPSTVKKQDLSSNTCSKQERLWPPISLLSPPATAGSVREVSLPVISYLPLGPADDNRDMDGSGELAPKEDGNEESDDEDVDELDSVLGRKSHVIAAERGREKSAVYTMEFEIFPSEWDALTRWRTRHEHYEFVQQPRGLLSVNSYVLQGYDQCHVLELGLLLLQRGLGRSIYLF